MRTQRWRNRPFPSAYQESENVAQRALDITDTLMRTEGLARGLVKCGHKLAEADRLDDDIARRIWGIVLRQLEARV